MTWVGVNLSEDQRAVSEMVLEWREPLAPLDTDEDAAAEAVRAGIVELGVWSMGMPESVGGDDAAIDLRLAAFAALGGRFAALAWGCAQAHAAAEVLAGTGGDGELLSRIVAGEEAVAVVDLGSVGAQLTIDGGRASGTIARIDHGGARPALVILDGDDTAWVVEPSAIRAREAHRRTGFGGARTSSVVIDGAAVRLSGVPVSGVRARLRLAGAAIAAGIALDAAGLAEAYASSRVQFGGPLTALPTVRHSLDQQRRLAVLSLSAAVCDDGESVDRATGTLAQNLGRAIEVAAAALQSHGGYGYIEEYGVARLLRDAVSLRAATSMI